MIRVTGVIAIAFLIAMAGNVRFAHAQEDPVTFLSLDYKGECDKENRHLWLINKHATKTIIATLRWHLAKSTRVVTDQFEITAGQSLEIGCAAQADIASAQFAS